MDAVSNEGGNEAGVKLARWMDGTRRDSTGLRVGVGVGSESDEGTSLRNA